MLRRDAAPFVNLLRRSRYAIFDRVRPNQIAVAFHHGMSAAPLQSLVRIKRGVDASKNHESSAVSRHLSQRIPAQRVAGMYADAYYISGLYACGVQAF